MPLFRWLKRRVTGDRRQVGYGNVEPWPISPSTACCPSGSVDDASGDPSPAVVRIQQCLLPVLGCGRGCVAWIVSFSSRKQGSFDDLHEGEVDTVRVPDVAEWAIPRPQRSPLPLNTHCPYCGGCWSSPCCAGTPNSSDRRGVDWPCHLGVRGIAVIHPAWGRSASRGPRWGKRSIGSRLLEPLYPPDLDQSFQAIS